MDYRILQMNNMETENSACPVRDYRRVEIMQPITATRAVRFGLGTGVKRACPMLQKPSAKSLNPYKSVILIIYDNVNVHGGGIIKIKAATNFDPQAVNAAEVGGEFIIELPII